MQSLPSREKIEEKIRLVEERRKVQCFCVFLYQNTSALPLPLPLPLTVNLMFVFFYLLPPLFLS